MHAAGVVAGSRPAAQAAARARGVERSQEHFQPVTFGELLSSTTRESDFLRVGTTALDAGEGFATSANPWSPITTHRLRPRLWTAATSLRFPATLANIRRTAGVLGWLPRVPGGDIKPEHR